MDLIAVAAVSENDVIGTDGELPWPTVPADKRQYRNRVAGGTVVMGRRTFELMRDDLPGADQIVLSRDPDREYEEETVTIVSSVSEAIDLLEESDRDRGYVIGGGGIYDAFFPELDTLVISRIPGRYGGETTFPPIDPNEWERIEERQMEGFTLEIWNRTGG